MKPHLSIIVTSRNDEHDGLLLIRMQLFLNVFFYNIKKYMLGVELIIIEWNPDLKKKRLSQVLNLSQKPINCVVRIITVSAKMHKTYENSDKINLFQFIAKNVGIRRAKGEFVLATNIDILFSEELFYYLFKKRHKANTFLRTVRFDVPKSIEVGWNGDEILRYCQKHIIRAYWPWGTDNYLNKSERLSNLLWKSRLKKIFYDGVFTNACGDFTFMSNSDWKVLQGYPEFPTHGVKIDGLLCYAAIINGMSQIILDPLRCVYHIDHKSSWVSGRTLELQKRLTKRGIPFISTEQYNQLIKKMRDQKTEIILNNISWGLGEENLPEVST